MPATIIPFTPTTTLFEPAEKRGSALATRQKKGTRIKSVDEPETRLWKVCAREGSRNEVIIEWIIFAVFVFIALAVLACFVEVQQQTDAMGQATVEVIQR